MLRRPYGADAAAAAATCPHAISFIGCRRHKFPEHVRRLHQSIAGRLMHCQIPQCTRMFQSDETQISGETHTRCVCFGALSPPARDSIFSERSCCQSKPKDDWHFGCGIVHPFLFIEFHRIAMMKADQVAEMLSSVRLGEEDTVTGEEEEDADLSSFKKTEADYKRNVQYLSHFLIKAIKASDGDMQNPIVVGALNALRERITSSFAAVHDGTPVTILPNLYENKVRLIKRFSKSSSSWILLAKEPETEIVCIIQIKNGWYHLGVYDSSLRPAASGYITRENMEIEGVDLDITDVQRQSVSFYLLSQDLAERSGLDVGPTFRRYILKLGDENERIVFKEAYLRASKHNQAFYDVRNAGDSVDSDCIVDNESESTVSEENVNANDSTGCTSTDEGGENGGSSDSTCGDDSEEDSIERRLASINESQADHLFSLNRRFA